MLLHDGGWPRRPKRVLLADPALAGALASALAAVEIARQTVDLRILEEVIRKNELYLYKGQLHQPGLLSAAGVTPELVGRLFPAARSLTVGAARRRKKAAQAHTP